MKAVETLPVTVGALYVFLPSSHEEPTELVFSNLNELLKLAYYRESQERLSLDELPTSV